MAVDYVALIRFLLIGIGLLLAFVAMVTWARRNDAPGAVVFSILMASMAVYALAYAGEVAQTTLSAAENWLDFEYLALPASALRG